MHHLVDVPAALAELHRIVKPGGTAVIEHASKFHLKSLLRWLLRRQDWNPSDHKPIEFVEMNFNFHPVWMRQQLAAAGFTVQNTRTVSHYRLDLLKRTVPTAWLVKLDSWAQPTGNWWQLTPSLFVQIQAQKALTQSPSGFFRCPVCGSSLLSYPNLHTDASDAVLTCLHCQRRWSYQNGIYDFKTPL
jgi:DNA-directed RNA polymerase subunit M/transcription elongation factor TFIIS